MRSADKLLKTAFLILIGLFCLAMVNLFLLRFKSGDIYPAYSSFSADPMGTKALYDSLVSLKGRNAARSFVPIEQIKAAKDTCIIVAGLKSGPHLWITEKKYAHIERLTDEGCRLVIALTPGEDTPVPKTSKRVDLYKKLGITIQQTRFTRKNLYAAPSDAVNVHYPLASTPWQQAFWFKTDSPDWKTIYSFHSEEPVIIEKKKLPGSGSMVLLADAYILSNESLKANHNSALLTWLMGNKKQIRFDEYHLGVQKKPGISNLVKKYGLYGPAGLLIIFVVLLLWKQSSVLIPPDEEEELDSLNHSKNKNAQTKDQMTGLTSLLKQHIPKKQIIPQCIDAWKNAFVMDNKASQKYARAYEKIKTAVDHDADNRSDIDTYIQICRILSEKEKI